MSPLSGSLAAGDPGFTSENFTPFDLAKSGIDPKYGRSRCARSAAVVFGDHDECRTLLRIGQ